nr:melanoma inhibitory activity protein 3-like isoform X2 [Microcebus murinus]
MDVKRLFILILLLSSPCHPSRKLAHSLPHHVQLGPQFLGILQKTIVIVAYLGIVILVCYICCIIFPIHDPQHEANLQQISEDIDNFLKKNAEVVGKISIFEQKFNKTMECLQDLEREHKMLLDASLKFKRHNETFEETNKIADDIMQICARVKLERHQNAKNANLSGDITDYVKELNLRAWRSSKCCLEGIKNKVEKNCEELQCSKAEKEAKTKMLQMEVDNRCKLFQQRAATVAEKLKMENIKREQYERNLSQVEKELKQTTEEMESYKEANLTHREEIESMKEQQQLVELHRRHQIATSEMAAHHYWLKTQVLARERVEQAREAARLRHRLEMMQEVEYGAEKPAPRKSDTQSPLHTADSGPQSVARGSSSRIPSTNAQKEKVEVDARGPPCADMPKPMAGPLSARRGNRPLPHPWCLLKLSPQLKGHRSDNRYEI